jgi:hypothetical protein
MKYIYINTAENRICTQSPKPIKDLQIDPNLTEYKVSDDFDLDLIVTGEDGQEVKITGAITATEFLSRQSADYVQGRVNTYPEITEQLDMLWHAMDADESKRLEPFYTNIKTIKDTNPRPEAN